MTKETIEKAKGFFKAHGPEIMKNVAKVVNENAMLLALYQEKCTMVGIYIPKKKPENQEDIDWLMNRFRSEMEDVWKKQQEKRDSEESK